MEPGLPLWGRWLAEGETEEGSTTLPTLVCIGEMLLHLSRPRSRSATLPRGEGVGCEMIIYIPVIIAQTFDKRKDFPEKIFAKNTAPLTILE